MTEERLAHFRGQLSKVTADSKELSRNIVFGFSELISALEDESHDFEAERARDKDLIRVVLRSYRYLDSMDQKEREWSVHDVQVAARRYLSLNDDGTSDG
jgi:hypothetical protein